MTEEFIRRGHVVLGCARSSAAVTGLRKRFAASHDFDVVDVSQDAQVGAWAARSALR